MPVITNSKQRSWFVFLMIFILGWSNSVLALVMHEQSNAVMMPHTENVMMDCHQSTAVASVEHLDNHYLKMMQHCKSDLENSNVHQHCADCSLMQCQSSISTIITNNNNDLTHQYADEPSIANFNYQVNVLSGHLQDILRPPKA